MDLAEGVGESSSPPRSFGSFSNHDVRNDVFNRLVEAGMCNLEFREKLDAHFNRLPVSYGLDVNMDRLEDILIHHKLLAVAKDPEKRPAYHIRFLENLGTRADGGDDQQFVNITSTTRTSLDADNEGVVPSNKSTRIRDTAIDFEPCSKLEDLNLDRKSSGDMEERYFAENSSGRTLLIPFEVLDCLSIMLKRISEFPLVEFIAVDLHRHEELAQAMSGPS